RHASYRPPEAAHAPAAGRRHDGDIAPTIVRMGRDAAFRPVRKISSGQRSGSDPGAGPFPAAGRGRYLVSRRSGQRRTGQDRVRNERRQSYENRPYGIVDEAVFHALFPPGHPYRPAIIGSHLDIQAAGLADVRDFFKRYYRPNNATLTLVGDFDLATAKRLVQKYFGSFK